MRFILASSLLFAPAFCAERHHVIATEYYHTFSAAHPVLKRIQPGDQVVTKTVDSAGYDLEGVRRTKTHGNPLTGAFYVEGVLPGDALAVRIDSLKPNRPTGYSGYQASVKDLPPEMQGKKPGMGAMYPGYDYLVPWVIDLKRGVVYPKGRADFRTAVEYNIQPMLGCIGTAPEGDYSPRSGPSGYWGGNMDYNMIRPATKVYLPVHHPGGLLFFGDGHALQGDGEPVGAGIETSLDVEVTVSARKGWMLRNPRAETADWIISIGAKEQGTIEERMGLATADMVRWLVTDYEISAAEAHLIIGMQARYDVLSFAGAVALRIPKAALAQR